MNKVGKWLLSVLFVAYIFSVGIYLVLSPDKKVSDVENRNLAQQPDFTIQSFVDGIYMKNVNNYITDQFPGRNYWLEAYMRYQRISNKTYLYNYYVADNGWIMPQPKDDFPKEKMNKTIDKVDKLSNVANEQGIEFNYFLLPHKRNIIDVNYPSYVEDGTSQRKRDYFAAGLESAGITVTDVGSIFKNKFSQNDLRNIYFKTDHHWNINGSYEAYKIIINKFHDNPELVESKPVARSELKKKCVKDKFFEGSYNRQIYNIVDSQSELKCTLFPKDEQFKDYKIHLKNKLVSLHQIYGSAFVTDKEVIDYSDLFTRDYAEYTITNSSLKQSNSKILLVKDSYSNATSFLIAQHFYETTVYDIRHNKASLYDYIKKHDFDAVAVMYIDTQVSGKLFKFDSGS